MTADGAKTKDTMREAPGSAEAPTAAPGTRLLVVRDAHVVGETAPASPASAAAPVSLGTLVAFAEALALAGNAAAGLEAAPFDVKTVSMSARAANRLTGEARRQSAPPGLSVWMVTVQDDREREIATLVLTFALRAAPVRPDPVRTGSVRTGAARTGPVQTGAPAPRGTVPAGDAAETPLDRILAGATEIIARKGFAQATMREIAEATGMHVPTLYAHVKGKDELLELIYAHEMDRLALQLERVPTGASAAERVRRMMEIALAVSDERRRQIGILNRELKSLGPVARARMLARYRALVGRYETVIQEGIAAGEFREIDALVAANFVDMISDIWALRQFFLSEIPLESYRDAAIAFAMKGLMRE